jgi:hypothetical protein
LGLGDGSAWLIRALLRLGDELSLEPLDELFTVELPGERTPLGMVPGTKGGCPAGRGVTGEVDDGVEAGSGNGVEGVAVGAGTAGVGEGLRALGLLLPQAVAMSPSATNRAILE